MPLIKIEHIAEGTSWGIWRTSESLDFFLPQVPQGFMTGFEATRFSEVRKKEFLASRFLLSQLLGDESLTLENRPNGSVAVTGRGHQISISHSGEMIAVIVSNHFAVGIDVEQIRERVKKVMRRFLNDDELKSLGGNPELWKIVWCWSAKESIYKMLQRPGLSFRNHIRLAIPNDLQEKKAAALIMSNEVAEKAAIFFERVDDFILTWCFKKHD